MKTKTPTDPARLRALNRALRSRTDHRDGSALHSQLRLAVLHCVHSGQWVSGDRVPPEAELAEASGMSLGTVQRALRDLTEEGVIWRKQGSGSFVAGASHRIDDVAYCRFLDKDGSTVLPVFSHVHSRRPAPRNGPWATYFPAQAEVVRLDRVLNVNDEFDVFSRFYFDGARFKGLASRPISELAGMNLKRLLGDEAQLPPGGVSQTMRLVPAPPEAARHMGLDEDSWVAQMEIVRHVAGSREALYYQQMFVPPTGRELVTCERATRE